MKLYQEKHLVFCCSSYRCRAVFEAKAKCRMHISKFHKDTSAGIDTKHIKNKLYNPTDIPPLRLGNVAERKSKEQRKR